MAGRRGGRPRNATAAGGRRSRVLRPGGAGGGAGLCRTASRLAAVLGGAVRLPVACLSLEAATRAALGLGETGFAASTGRAGACSLGAATAAVLG